MPSVWAIRITAGIGAIGTSIFREELCSRWIVRLMPKETRLLLRPNIDIKETDGIKIWTRRSTAE